MNTKKILFLISLLLLLPALIACKKEENNNMKNNTIKYPERIKKSVIYEVNIRQYTPEGTFKAFEPHLQRLHNLGVDILWFMPIQPIGIKNRKGSLGSYYSIQNYTAINPEFGTLDDFKRIVEKAHKLGMLVLIDWVANHTSFDNVWIKEHPDWYNHDENGNIISPVSDWTDVADLNYDNHEMRNAMIESMKYWIKTCDIDGFRCDVAMMVPTDFWDSARVELDKVKPVFMLAEAEQPDLMLKAFDMNYTWDYYHLAVDIAHGKKTAADMQNYFLNPQKHFPKRAIPMRFTSNHDENSWNGTDSELYNGHQDIFTAMIFTLPGMPLIYSGQEACNETRLKFFDKDTINWKDCKMTKLYKDLIKLKHKNQALWNDGFGGNLQFILTTNADNVFAFIRKKDTNKVLCLFNLSDNEINCQIKDELAFGTYNDYFINQKIEINNNSQIDLKPWKYKILIAE